MAKNPSLTQLNYLIETNDVYNEDIKIEGGGPLTKLKKIIPKQFEKYVLSTNEIEANKLFEEINTSVTSVETKIQDINTFAKLNSFDIRYKTIPSNIKDVLIETKKTIENIFKIFHISKNYKNEKGRRGPEKQLFAFFY